jgi:single-strand DNA-binding protein
MHSLNRITLIGNIGDDPKLKILSSGLPVAKLSLATSTSYLNKQGNWQQRTEWHTLMLWNKQAEYATIHFRKGDKIYAEGKLIYREYTTPELGRKKVAEIQVDRIFSLEKKTADNTPLATNPDEMTDLPW